ncbi:MAG TPA: hypothetical protein VM582_03845 [Candidatus Thermoplasmatota archaeon]|nr:hypothetical protein [Candidatus Thermoplasmatota archaeon]
MSRALAVPLVLLALLAAGCVSPFAPAALQDAEAAAEVPRLAVLNETYDFGSMVTTTGRLGAPSVVRVHGAMYAPEGDGPFPVLLFMHGNHGTCFVAQLWVPGAGVCRDAGPMRVDPSFAGYSYLAEDLASRGFVVLSINANDVNDQNFVDDLGSNQRAQLFLRTLDELAARGDPRLDLSRVGLMGHSRGGDGAARAVVLNAQRADPYPLLGVFALAPTDFVRHEVVGVPFGTLLPYCDGDVWNLQGAWLYDDARYLEGAGPLHQYLVLGANHNFYNEVWDYDDATWARSDPACGPKADARLTPEEQRAGGLAIMGAFFRHYVGGEAALGAQLRGDAPFDAPRHEIHVSYMPPAGARLLVEDALAPDALRANDAGGATHLAGFREASHCTTAAAAAGPIPPVFLLRLVAERPQGTCPTEPNMATAPQLSLAWSQSATARFELAGADASAFSRVSFRTAVDFDATAAPPRVRVALVDADGRRAEVDAAERTGALFVPPGGEDWAKLVLNDVALPLEAFRGVDPARLAAIELVFEGATPGRAQLADVLFR